jgi:hypothetical protein
VAQIGEPDTGFVPIAIDARYRGVGGEAPERCQPWDLPPLARERSFGALAVAMTRRHVSCDGGQ